MATGDLIKMGTLYLNENKQLRPTNPQSGGNIVPPQGQTIEIRNTDPNDLYKMQWREINDNGKKYLVADRNYLWAVSWDELNAQSLVFGKVIEVDGQEYKLRLLTGGYNYRNGLDEYSGGSPANNEWDRWITNESNVAGLPKPSTSDLTPNGEKISGVHNQFWNWFNMTSWVQEIYVGSNEHRVLRGGSSARFLDVQRQSENKFTSLGWRPVLEFLNESPTLVLNTSNNQTLYENSVLTLGGSTIDTDSGDAVTVKYQINSGTVRNLHSAISDGSTAIPFSEGLTYKEGALKDGNTVLTSVLAEGTPHTISVWAEDGSGGKSDVQTRTFYVVPNRPPSLTIDPIAAQSELINSDVINVSGAVTDPDNNDVVVTFAINSEEPQQIYEGQPSSWAFNIALKDLRVGKNTIMIKAVDIYDAETSKVLTINKTHDATPVNEAIALYKINPPTGSAKEILLWIERQLGDLAIEAEISMTNEGEPENFVSIERTNSELKGVLQEDEFAYDAHEDKTNIIIKIVYNRNDAESQETIKKISGVLS